MKEYYMETLVEKHDGRKWTSHTIVKANSFDDALIEAENRACDLSRCDQKVTSLGKGYVLDNCRGCKW